MAKKCELAVVQTWCETMGLGLFRLTSRRELRTPVVLTSSSVSR